MDNKIRINLEEQFGKLVPQEVAPPELKEEVFETLDAVDATQDDERTDTSIEEDTDRDPQSGNDEDNMNV